MCLEPCGSRITLLRFPASLLSQKSENSILSVAQSRNPRIIHNSSLYFIFHISFSESCLAYLQNISRVTIAATAILARPSSPLVWIIARTSNLSPFILLPLTQLRRYYTAARDLFCGARRTEDGIQNSYYDVKTLYDSAPVSSLPPFSSLSLFSPSRILLQPHWPSSCSLNIRASGSLHLLSLLPRMLFSQISDSSLPHLFQVCQVPPSQWGLPGHPIWNFSPNINPSPHYIPDFIFSLAFMTIWHIIYLYYIFYVLIVLVVFFPHQNMIPGRNRFFKVLSITISTVPKIAPNT